MDIEKEFIDLLARGAREIGLTLTEPQLDLFRRYRRELLLWNSKMNLVSITTPLDLPVKHCLDSLLPAEFIEKTDGTLLDIGTGAGFPGIPLKIVMDALSVTLVDSSRKKTSFLRDVTGKMRLSGVRIVQGRIEQLAVDPEWRGAFDTVISRATFKLADFVRAGSPFLAPGGRLVAMKGRIVQPEWDDGLAAAEEAGLRPAFTRKMRLPLTGDSRIIGVFSTN
jgi:16S rRNA (guanine527-N7)-methyltransferase